MKPSSVTVVFLMLVLGWSTQALCQAKPYRGAEYRTIGTMTYGRFEVRMRSAQVSGMLASFFTYYDPANPWNEIDIETMGRYSNETQFNTIVPTQANNHVQRQPLPFNPHAAFHVYAIEWTPDYVAWQVDSTEVFRQTGAHIAQLVQPQKLMMNIWQPSDANWAGSFNPAELPVFVYYDWVKYYAYTPGNNSNFTLQWSDDFNSFDATRWQKATHTWDGNNSQFVQENVAFKDGYMILCLTDNQHSGYNGASVADKDVDPPYLVSARASIHQIRVLFSERLDNASAQNTGNYIVPGATVQRASLLADQRTVTLDMVNLNLSGSPSLIVVGVKDPSGNTMAAKSIKVAMPLQLPIRIDIGGVGSSGYLADSVWNFASEYGAVGGAIVQQPPTIDIAGTTEDDIFRSALEGLSFYKIRVPAELTYNVSLMLVEPKYQASGKRVFDAKLGGSQTMHIDIYQQAGYNSAWQPAFRNVIAPDGLIDLTFAPVVDKPVVSGIVIEPIGDGVEGSNQGGSGPAFGTFPNPFNGTTNFRFSLSRGGAVTIQVFDILGRRVSSIPFGYQEKGEHSVRWNAQSLPSGVYVCSMAAEGRVLSKRVLLVR
jgi:hypothetical protein